jgi:hypothetical protein
MLAPITHILALTTIRRSRMLPIPGRVLVRNGQRVNATDVVAEASLNEHHIFLDIQSALRLPRSEATGQLTDRKVGEKLTKGDVIAEDGSIFRRVLRAPEDGEIVAIYGPQVLLEVHSKPFTLLAGMSGLVSEVVPEKGVILETDGSLLQGVWGNGLVNQGVLVILARQPDDELTPDRMDVSLRGSVVLGGFCSSADTLRAAAMMPLRGLILSSMTADLIPLALEMEFPIMLLDGFGHLPINDAAYRVLTTSSKRDVCLNACAWDAFKGDRPELVIPLNSSGQLPHESTAFKEGQAVLVRAAPCQGKVGELVALRPGMTPLPNGLRSMAANIKLENNEVITVPLANLDVLE